MASFSFPVALLLFLLCLWASRSCHAQIYGFPMHHRFSTSVKNWSRLAGRGFGRWPEKGTVEYYSRLAHRHRIFRGRSLSQIDGPLAFAKGNSTRQIQEQGFLHYATVSLGTPAQEFLVALDTGSDTSWVPCDCEKCASARARAHPGSADKSGIYNPRASSTSRNVTCENRLCEQRYKCIFPLDNCPYEISYVSAGTSSSGILLEDVLHLTAEDDGPEHIEANIAFGCGQVQTGIFDGIAAPDGILGLGMERTSVPSILSSKGYTADSFSMCFGHDGIGRIKFGDKGTFDQEETPFNVHPQHPTYSITIAQIRVGTVLIDMEFTAIFDTGTSFPMLSDPIYSRLSKSFHSQTKDRRRPNQSGTRFEYCYDRSPDANVSVIPTLSITMNGGGQFAIHEAIFSPQGEEFYCLAVHKSARLNLIGQSFMTGYRIVFDREEGILGWKSFDCYEMED